MKSRKQVLAFGLAAGFAALVVAASGSARAGDEPPPGAAPAPSPVKKIDAPLLKALVGSWTIASKSEMGEATGTVTYALGVGGTALLQDYEVAPGTAKAFYGHGVWRPSDDGKKIDLWWIDTRTGSMDHYAGSLTDKGYDVKSEQGIRLTFALADKSAKFELFGPDGSSFFKDTYTKK